MVAEFWENLGESRPPWAIVTAACILILFEPRSPRFAALGCDCPLRCDKPALLVMFAQLDRPSLNRHFIVEIF
jgi:hypothetical protein